MKHKRKSSTWNMEERKRQKDQREIWKHVESGRARKEENTCIEKKISQGFLFCDFLDIEQCTCRANFIHESLLSRSEKKSHRGSFFRAEHILAILFLCGVFVVRVLMNPSLMFAISKWLQIRFDAYFFLAFWLKRVQFKWRTFLNTYSCDSATFDSSFQIQRAKGSNFSFTPTMTMPNKRKETLYSWIIVRIFRFKAWR
jgi:hypothetical protein